MSTSREPPVRPDETAERGEQERPHEVVLANGLRLLYEPMPWLPTLSATLLVPFGSATDPVGLEGEAAVLHEWLQRGAGELGSRALLEAFEDLGARFGGVAGREASRLSVSCLAADASSALQLLASIVTVPRLEEAEFGPSRDVVLEELMSIADSPTQLLMEELTARFLQGGHRRSVYGTVEGMAALTASGLREAIVRRVGARGAILALAGGGDWEELRALVVDAFGSWGGEADPLPEPRAVRGGQFEVAADTSQVQVGLAYPSALAGTPDGYLYSVALNALSGGMGSRLFTEIREKRGLVYSVSASSRALRGFGFTLGYAGTTPERAPETLEVFKAELRRLADGITADELERSKTGILSSLVLRGESSGATASRLASDAFLLGKTRTLVEVADEVRSVELGAVNRYLAEHPVPEPTVVLLGGAAATSEAPAGGSAVGAEA